MQIIVVVVEQLALFIIGERLAVCNNKLNACSVHKIIMCMCNNLMIGADNMQTHMMLMFLYIMLMPLHLLHQFCAVSTLVR